MSISKTYILFNSNKDNKTELVTKAEIIYNCIIGLYSKTESDILCSLPYCEQTTYIFVWLWILIGNIEKSKASYN
jgi:hypothetical protein